MFGYPAASMLKRLLLRLWAAAANKAFLEVIALHDPFYVCGLPVPGENLGKCSPLIFDSFDDLVNGSDSATDNKNSAISSAHHSLSVS